MPFSCDSLPSPATVASVATSLAATVILLRTIHNDLIPTPLRAYFKKLSARLSSRLTLVVDQSDGLSPNHLYDAVDTFLSAKLSPSIHRIKVNKLEKDHHLSLSVDKNQDIPDTFQIDAVLVKLNWVSQSTTIENFDSKPNKTELKYFELNFHKKHKEIVLNSYLPYVLRKAKEIKEERKTVSLHTVDYNGTDYWSSVPLNHPSTFETMAMEEGMKAELIEDLDRFLERKEYYRRVGKAWKRGYLFYGPPGTGKSSLVAAMANYLRFDVYDLDLREVQCNSDLRRLLIGTGNRSIVVVEDIDCNVGLQNREVETEAKIVEDDKVCLCI